MEADEQLIQQIQEGKNDAFGQLFRKYKKRIYSICLSIIKDPHDAEDVLQEIFIRAYLGLDQLKDKNKFSAWIESIARNCSRDFLRRNRKDTIPLSLATEQPFTQGAPDGLLLKRELIAAIMEAVNSLPKKDRELIRAYIDGSSHAEISEQFDISISASMTRLHRVRKKIIARMENILNAIFGLPKILSLKKAILGGFLAMKIGTSMKLTIGVIGVLVAGFVGFNVVTHQSDVKSPRVNKTELPPKASVSNQRHNSIALQTKRHKVTTKARSSLSDNSNQDSVEAPPLEDEKIFPSDNTTTDELLAEVPVEVSETEDYWEQVIFPAVESVVTSMRKLSKQRTPYDEESLRLSQRQMEILHTKPETREEEAGLYEEFQENISRINELASITNSFTNERNHLYAEFEEQYGISWGEAATRYREAHPLR